MHESETPPMIEVYFATASPRWQISLSLPVPSGSQVSEVLTQAQSVLSLREDAAARSALLDAPWQKGAVGIHGEVCSREHTVEAQDRVELYLPLQADPKLERRRRAQVAQTAKARNPLTVRGRR